MIRKFQTMIQLQQLSKNYFSANHSIRALSNITLAVKAGEIFGVIGKTGAGKSTLIRSVNLLERPSEGRVMIDGVDLCQLSPKALRDHRHQIGMIFQHFHLLESRTVYQNIAFPLELLKHSKQFIKETVGPLLELVELTDHKDYYPHQLSGGQKQRVAIARALATKPKLLLCDEATSALDPETTQSILQLLKKVNREFNLTILLITHDMDVIKVICDRVGVLSHGCLVEEGSVLDIFTEPKASETKRLTQSALHIELPAYLQEKLQEDYQEGLYPIVRLAFLGKSANEPVISNLQKKFHVNVNILRADLEFIHEAMVGLTVCQLLGEPKDCAQSIQYLLGLGLKVEVLGYV